MCVQLSEAHNLQAEVGDGWNGSKSQAGEGCCSGFLATFRDEKRRSSPKGTPKVKFKIDTQDSHV